MSDEAKVEAPVVEKPVLPEVKAPEIDKDVLLSELTKMGVKNADELVNMQRASSQVGQMANILGEVRKENAELKRMLQDVQRSSRQQDPYQDSTSSNAIDLQKVIEETVGKVIDNKLQRTQQQQVEAMRMQRAEMARIQGNKWFPAVKDIWEKYLNHPSTQDRLLAGESNLTEEYRNVVDTYTARMLDAQTQALQAARPAAAMPHVESGNTQSVQNIPASDELKAKKRSIVEARSKGHMDSDSALDALVKSMLPVDDPMWRAR